MHKNKFIGIAIWVLTIIGPFSQWLIYDYTPDMYYVTMFLLTLVGIGAGAYFYSKKERSTDRVA